MFCSVICLPVRSNISVYEIRFCSETEGVFGNGKYLLFVGHQYKGRWHIYIYVCILGEVRTEFTLFNQTILR